MKKTEKDNQNQEINIQKRYTYRTNAIGGIVAGLLFCTLIALLFMAFSRVEIETEGFCNSGHISLDIEANNVIQNKSCIRGTWDENGTTYYEPDPYNQNVTCFKTDLMLKHIKLKDIDGLNCQGSAKIKMPLILTWFMGDDEW